MKKTIILVCLYFYLVNITLSADDVLSKFHQTDYKLRFERALTLFKDDTFMKIYEIKTFKFNRSSSAVNLTFEFRQDVDDLEGQCELFRLSRTNVFRPMAAKFSFSFCNFLDKNIFGLGRYYFNQGNKKCPFKKDVKYHVGNYYPDEKYFPPFMPNGEYKVEMAAYYASRTKVAEMEAYCIVYRNIPIPIE